MHDLGSPWRLVLMGHATYGMELIKQACPDLIHISHIDAPEHLDVTSHAYVGLVTYSYKSLNNIFCAPNKIWEYAAFGVPLVCSPLWFGVVYARPSRGSDGRHG